MEGKGVFLHTTLRVQSITEGNQNKNSRHEPRGSNLCRGYGRMLLTGFLRTCFYNPQDPLPRSGTAHIGLFNINHQPINMPQVCSGTTLEGPFSQVRFIFPDNSSLYQLTKKQLDNWVGSLQCIFNFSVKLSSLQSSKLC